MKAEEDIRERRLAVETIVQALKERRLLPFVGAGVSSWPGVQKHVSDLGPAIEQLTDTYGDAGKAIAVACDTAHHMSWLPDDFDLNGRVKMGWPPTWFLHLCMLALTHREDRGQCTGLTFSALAQFLKCGPTTKPALAGMLYSFFNKDGAHYGKPNELHRLIAQLPCRYIVTTNYDSGLENASEKTPRPLRVVKDDISLTKESIEGRRVFKLHGDLGTISQSGRPITSEDAEEILAAIVFPEETYWQYPGQPHRPGSRDRLSKLISALLPLSQVIFLGYGFGDSNIHEIFRHAGHWPLDRQPLLVVEHMPTAAFKAFWQAREVRVIYVERIEKLLGAVADEIWHQLGKSEHRNGEIHDPSLALGAQRVLDLIPSHEDKPTVVRRLVEHSTMFSVEAAAKLGLQVTSERDLQPLVDLGWLRVVHPEAGLDPKFFALDLDLRFALIKWVE